MAFGQYSYDSPGKLTLAEIIPTYGVSEARKAGHNRALWTDGACVRHFRLIRTDVVSFDPAEGWIEIDTGGWATMTTRRAIEQGFEALGLLAEHYPGYTTADGKRAPDPWRWDDAAQRSIIAPGVEWRRIKRAGVLPDDWTARCGGASRKGDGASVLVLGTGSLWGGDAELCVRFARRATLKLDADGIPHVHSSDLD